MRNRFLAALVTLLLLLVLPGCSQSAPEVGANPGSGAKPEKSAQPQTSAQPQPASAPSANIPSGPQATTSSPSGMYVSTAGSGTGSGSPGGVLADPPIQYTPPSGDGPDWCEAGLAYAAPDSSNYGFSEMKVIGLVPFKGNTYCKAEYRMEAPGQKIVYTIYFLENEADAWMVMDVNGVVQEIHLDN